MFVKHTLNIQGTFKSNVHVIFCLQISHKLNIVSTISKYTVLPKVLAPLLMKGLTTLVISMSSNLNV